MCYKPDDPIEYLESCLQKVKELGGSEKVKWDTFVSPEKKTLPPLNGGQSRRSFFRNVMPDNSNFPYRRYDRLPPIQQFSIESDTDLSETAELIEEYDVFDPARPRPKIILVIGGPGSGKGTQSLKIAERYGFNYISVGELLRKKIHSTSSNRKWSLIAKIITTGELAPQETTITEIKQRLMQIPDEEGVVIDGFPRDVAQAISFEDQICTPDLVVFLSCSSQRLKERLLKRAEQQGRPDDNLKATQRRLMNFKQNAVPLVKYFQEKGLIITFDADRDEEEVFFDISSAVDNKLFANKEAAVGANELDCGLIMDSGDTVYTEFDFEDQEEDQSSFSGYESTGDFSEDLRKSNIIFVVGGPGSGKGSQCEQLAKKYGFTHLSTDDLLQNELSSLSERSKLIKDIMESGEPVPGGIVLELLKEAMVSKLGDTKGFLLDGYPRELKEAEEFESKIGEPQLVFCLDCSAETMSHHLLMRNQSSQESDNTETVKEEIESYYQASKPLIAYYERKTQLCKVDAEGTQGDVFLEFCKTIDSFLRREEEAAPAFSRGAAFSAGFVRQCLDSEQDGEQQLRFASHDLTPSTGSQAVPGQRGAPQPHHHRLANLGFGDYNLFSATRSCKTAGISQATSYNKLFTRPQNAVTTSRKMETRFGGVEVCQSVTVEQTALPSAGNSFQSQSNWKSVRVTQCFCITSYAFQQKTGQLNHVTVRAKLPRQRHAAYHGHRNLRLLQPEKEQLGSKTGGTTTLIPQQAKRAPGGAGCHRSPLHEQRREARGILPVCAVGPDSPPKND
ncbi:PREDICTED: adenylate kinase isoenzyme 5 [Eurypyga helias]|uniref:adenylate kinase isoenzyme 5 n=1 Tax=Eurypyga helias TaxID=54383 RepID=UPI0005289F20|nr:PREDICTED: adenylate kinase isoenzyme 5 [Eurypyga helias]